MHILEQKINKIYYKTKEISQETTKRDKRWKYGREVTDMQDRMSSVTELIGFLQSKKGPYKFKAMLNKK